MVAVAILAAALYAYSAAASTPTTSPFIVNSNGTLVGGVQIANATIAFATQQLFFYSNFSSENASAEENSMSEIRDFRASSEAKASETFKWYKRTQYQPQNRSLVGYWKLNGNANGDNEEIA